MDIKNNIIFKKDLFITVSLYLIIFFFAFSAIRKVIYFEAFRKEIFPFLFNNSGYAIIATSVYEIVLVLLLLGRKRLLGLYFGLGLFVIMTSYLFTILHNNLGIPEYFGAIIPNLSILEQAIANLILIQITVNGIIYYSKERGKLRQINTKSSLQQVHL